MTLTITLPPKIGDKVRIKSGWDEAGKQGVLRAIDSQAYHNEIVASWAMVLWDGEEDPDCFKLTGLEVAPESVIPPRPWEARSLMIVDKLGREVFHLGGRSTRDPAEICAIVSHIVDAVNHYESYLETHKSNYQVDVKVIK